LEINVNFLSVLDSILPIRWFVLLMGTVLQRILVHVVDHILVHFVTFKVVLDSLRMTHVYALVKEIVLHRMFANVRVITPEGTVNSLFAVVFLLMILQFALTDREFVRLQTFAIARRLGMERHVKLQYVLERMQQTLPFARREVLVLHQTFVHHVQETTEVTIANGRFVMDY
jgi:hypothetical protein